jgi:glyoxylase-like metal-dependent hydrolase (beta-lactamase superfamily II)
MTEIEPGIYQLQIPIPNNPLGCTNVYLLKGDKGCTLIDAGWSSREALYSLGNQLTEAGVSFKDISLIIVTHAHFDHYGLADSLKQLSGAKVALHHLDRDLLAPRFTDMDEYLRQTENWFRINGVPTHELPQSAFIGMRRSAPPAAPDIALHDGEIVPASPFNLQVTWTPGHSPGHICLYETNRKIFFSGDHILPVITPNISLQPNSSSNPLGDFLNSLNKIKPLDVTLVLPAHEHIFTNFRGRIDEIIQHHEQRNSEILGAMSTGAQTAYQISQQITWMPEFGGMRFHDLAPMDKRMAVSETLAHLEAMRIQGSVAQANRDGIIHYQRTKQR